MSPAPAAGTPPDPRQPEAGARDPGGEPVQPPADSGLDPDAPTAVLRVPTRGEPSPAEEALRATHQDAGVAPAEAGLDPAAPTAVLPPGAAPRAADPALADTRLDGAPPTNSSPPRGPVEEALPFQLGARLGGGGAGEVFAARVQGDPRPLAVKLLKAGSSPGALQRFLREGELAARLDAHPHVVRVLSAGCLPAGAPYLLFERVDGVSLARLIDDTGPLPLERALSIARQVGSALAHAHAHGVVHRDLKPANVLIDTEGRARLTDFGAALARDQPRITAEGQLVGTLAYLAPEQSGLPDTGQQGPWTDVHALGLLCHAMLAGESPFLGGHPAAVLHQVLRVSPAGLASLRPDVPRPLAAVVARCLEKDPGARYPDAGAVCAALDALESGAAPAAEHALRGVVLAALLLALGCGLLAAGLVRAAGPPTPRRAAERPPREPPRPASPTPAPNPAPGMSEDTALLLEELVRRQCAAINAESLDGVLAIFHPESPVLPLARRSNAEAFANFELRRIELVAFEPVGADEEIACAHSETSTRVVPLGGGEPRTSRLRQVWVFRRWGETWRLWRSDLLWER